MEDKLSGRKALVVGASSGIGKEIGITLAGLGIPDGGPRGGSGVGGLGPGEREVQFAPGEVLEHRWVDTVHTKRWPQA